MGIDGLLNYEGGGVPLLVSIQAGIVLIVVDGTKSTSTHNVPGPSTLGTGVNSDPQLTRSLDARYSGKTKE